MKLFEANFCASKEGTKSFLFRLEVISELLILVLIFLTNFLNIEFS